MISLHLSPKCMLLSEHLYCLTGIKMVSTFYNWLKTFKEKNLKISRKIWWKKEKRKPHQIPENINIAPTSHQLNRALSPKHYWKGFPVGRIFRRFVRWWLWLVSVRKKFQLLLLHPERGFFIVKEGLKCKQSSFHPPSTYIVLLLCEFSDVK